MNFPCLKSLAAIGAFACCVMSAHAVGITGGISLAGDYTMNGATLGSATAFTSFSNIEVTSTSGSFTGAVTEGIAGTVSMTPFSFSPFVGPVSPLWTTIVGGSASFSLSSFVITFQNANSLVLDGAGTLTLAGFDPTPGLWTFSANTMGGTFSWSSSNGAVVPDSGTTSVIFGLGLASLALAARRFGVISR